MFRRKLKCLIIVKTVIRKILQTIRTARIAEMPRIIRAKTCRTIRAEMQTMLNRTAARILPAARTVTKINGKERQALLFDCVK